MPDPPKPTKGLRVGKYILKETLGTGFFAEVKLAIHVDTSKKYAIKIIDKRKVPLKDLERQIKREVKIMQYLRHDFIVSVHQVLMSGTRMYLVMDYVSGGELFDLIVKRQRVDEDESRKYFQQLVDAVSYCHSKGVYHRDLKPENLLLDENNNLKITDFGMSFLTDNATDAADALLYTHCGTPEYMAPELACRSHKGYKGDKLDVWSCGVILFVLLAGGLPFSGKTDAEIFRQITKKKILYPSWFSNEVCDLLDALLVKDPEERIGLGEVKKHPWFLVNYQEHVAESGRIKMPAPLQEAENELPSSEYVLDILSPTGLMSPRGNGVPPSLPANPSAVAEALQDAVKANKTIKSPDSIMDADTGSSESLPQQHPLRADDEPAPTSVRKLFGKKGDEGSFRVRVPSFLISPRPGEPTSPNGMKSSGSRMGMRGFSAKRAAMAAAAQSNADDPAAKFKSMEETSTRKDPLPSARSDEVSNTKKGVAHIDSKLGAASKTAGESDAFLSEELSPGQQKRKQYKDKVKLFGRRKADGDIKSPRSATASAHEL